MTIDTNIIIAYLSGEVNIVNILSSWRARGGFLYLPTIVEVEVLSFPKLSQGECFKIQIFFKENFISVPLDRRIINVASELRRTTKIKLADAVIAATAIITDTSLFTRNVKDFRKIKKLRIVSH